MPSTLLIGLNEKSTKFFQSPKDTPAQHCQSTALKVENQPKSYTHKETAGRTRAITTKCYNVVPVHASITFWLSQIFCTFSSSVSNQPNTSRNFSDNTVLRPGLFITQLKLYKDNKQELYTVFLYVYLQCSCTHINVHDLYSHVYVNFSFLNNQYMFIIT